MTQDNLGNNPNTTINEHIENLKHKMNKASITNEYASAYSENVIPCCDLGTGYEELVEYENSLGDSIGDQTR